MKLKTHRRFAGGVCLAAVSLFGLAGCSTDENPITPQKMQQIRQKEQTDRQNFHPSMTPPPGQGK